MRFSVLTGKLVLTDEAELSAVTGNPVASSVLKTCGLTGKRAFSETGLSCLSRIGAQSPKESRACGSAHRGQQKFTTRCYWLYMTVCHVNLPYILDATITLVPGIRAE